MSKKIITLLLIATMLTSMTACSGAATTPDPTTEETTTAEVTTPEPTTQEPTTEESTTEEPTTEYVYKGMKLDLSKELFPLENGLILEKGGKLYINDVVPEKYSDSTRGAISEILVLAIYGKYHPEKVSEFQNMYLEPGAANIHIAYDENFFIEYVGEEKLYFEFVEEDDELLYYDVYAID